MTKLPPIEKIYEAWTAIEDDRVKLLEDHAEVVSSDGSKEYMVRFSGNRYSSDDNAAYWRGYAGYPVIAVLMLQGRLTFDREEARKWKDVNWKELNTRFKNKYALAVAEVETLRGIDPAKADEAAAKVMEELASLPIEIKRKI